MAKEVEAAPKVVFICSGSKCKKHNRELLKYFKDAIKEHALKKEVEIVRISCTGRCKLAPIVSIQPNNKWYSKVDEKGVKSLISKYLVDKKKI